MGRRSRTAEENRPQPQRQSFPIEIPFDCRSNGSASGRLRKAATVTPSATIARTWEPALPVFDSTPLRNSPNTPKLLGREDA